MAFKQRKKVTILGASIGGLVSAAELAASGFDVTIIEKGKSVGGLYSKVETPFGEQELGMHVLYVNQNQFSHLSEIFGKDSFHILSGTQVDIGSCENFGHKFFNSHYPNVIGHHFQEKILQQLKETVSDNKKSLNAREEIIKRFGKTAATEVVNPILETLWKTKTELLTPDAIHCFFDLRRIVACTKREADTLKTDEWLDRVLANPDQLRPKGTAYDGRIGLIFKKGHDNISERVSTWAQEIGVELKFESEVLIDDGLYIDNLPAHENTDACIVALPLHNLVPALANELDQLELSIYYLQTSEKISDEFPAYYLLSHSSNFKTSRIVNYDSYDPDTPDVGSSVIAVEVIHELDNAPPQEEIVSEVELLFPSLNMQESYQLPKSLKFCSPTINNSRILDSVSQQIKHNFVDKPIYFSGMRTDKGVFFSHHTIGAAYEAALDYKRRVAQD